MSYKQLFKVGDKVGFTSNTEFTKENKLIPPQRVLEVSECVDAQCWEYRITNYLGWHMQHELELR